MTSAYGGAGPNILACGWTLAGITTILVALRIYVRARLTTIGGWALVWTIVAWALAVATQACGAVAIHYGIGNHVEEVIEAGTLEDALFWTTITFCLFSVAVAWGKLAVVSFIFAVQEGTSKSKAKYFLMFLAVIIIILGFGDIFTLFFECEPREALWKPELAATANCNRQRNLDYATFVGSWCALTDLVYALYPIRIIWPLQMPKKVKAGICVVMGLGVFASVAACLRTYYLGEVVNTTDPTYAYNELLYWGSIEMFLVIILTCIPALWPIIKPSFQIIMSLSYTSRKSSPNHSTLKQKKKSFMGGNQEHKGFSQRLNSQDGGESREHIRRQGSDTEIGVQTEITVEQYASKERNKRNTYIELDRVERMGLGRGI